MQWRPSIPEASEAEDRSIKEHDPERQRLANLMNRLRMIDINFTKTSDSSIMRRYIWALRTQKVRITLNLAPFACWLLLLICIAAEML